MRTTITEALIRKLGRQPVTVFDTQQRALSLRMRVSGIHTYRVELGRGKFLTLGGADALTPTKAREQARIAMGQTASGKDPIAERRKKQASTLGAFLDGPYREWAVANQRGALKTIDRVTAVFKDFKAKPLPEITSFAIERWRAQRHKAGLSPATTNRDLASLGGVFSRAVAWGLLDINPLRAVKRAKLDTIGRLRYLSSDEEGRLRTALSDREQTNREARARFNAWRVERGYKPVPDFAGPYTDHLQPMVLLALHTGLRRGELLALHWGDVDLPGTMLTVSGSDAKTGKTRHVPLNSEAANVLRAWRPDRAESGALVFPGHDGQRMKTITTAWRAVAKNAKLTGFNFHDLRHSFASRLVQRGVDLNTVRELLGHADIKMTLRYAHLAPENKAAAVALLTEPAPVDRPARVRK